MKHNILILLSAAVLIFAACAKEDKSCPTGLTGANCDETIIPKSIVINRVKVTGVPPLRANGKDWDDTEAGAERAPDLIVRIRPNILGAAYITGASVLPNTNLSGGQSVIIGFNNPLNPAPYKITQNLTGDFGIGVFDWDNLGPSVTYEEMDFVLFRFYEPGRAFPKNLLLNSPQATYELELEYEY